MVENGPCVECGKNTTGWLVTHFMCDNCYDKLEKEALAEPPPERDVLDEATDTLKHVSENYQEVYGLEPSDKGGS